MMMGINGFLSMKQPPTMTVSYDKVIHCSGMLPRNHCSAETLQKYIHIIAMTTDMRYLLLAIAQKTKYTVEQSQNNGNTVFSVKNEWMSLVKEIAVSCRI